MGVFSQRMFAGLLVREREMREVTECEIREVGGHRQITKPTHEPPFWLNYRQVVHKVLFDYLPSDTVERVTEERIRLIILAHYVWAGRTAKDTCQYLSECGYSLTENAVYLAVDKLTRRAEKLCEQLGINPPVKKDKLPRFDRHQFERRFRKTTSRTPATGRGRLTGIVDLAVDGDEDAITTLSFYNWLTQEMLCKLGASKKYFHPKQGLTTKPERFCSTYRKRFALAS